RPPSTGVTVVSPDWGADSVGGASSARVASASALRPAGPGRLVAVGWAATSPGATARPATEGGAVMGVAVASGSVGLGGREPGARLIGVLPMTWGAVAGVAPDAP